MRHVRRKGRTLDGFAPKLVALTEEMNQDGRKILLPLLGAAALVLLIGCGNTAALLLVRGLQRQQEYAVRSAMGMGRGALLRQVATESLLLALLGGGRDRVGVWRGEVVQVDRGACDSAAGGCDDGLAGAGVGIGRGGDGLGAGGDFAGVVGVSAAADGSAQECGAEGDRGNRRAAPFARGDDGANGADACAAGRSGLVDSNHDEHAKVPSGYDTGRILTMSVTEVQGYDKWTSFHRHALQRVSAVPGVEHAAFAWGVPLTGNNWPGMLEIEGQPPATKDSEKSAVPMRAVTEDYFNLMGLAMIAGRQFRSTDEGRRRRWPW